MHVDSIQNVAVVGAGLMGHGIALELALSGYRVGLNDLTDTLLEGARARIETNLEMLRKAGRIRNGQPEAALARIHTHTDLGKAVSEADVVIEAMAENLEQKQAVFAQLDALCPGHTILASNSSSFTPAKLAPATQRPEKVVGAHYFNPPFLVPLVEIIRGEKTSDQTVELIHALMLKLGKSPVIVKKETPGFIANRLQAALWRESLSLVAEGVATPQDVDRVVKTSIGRRLSVAGVFEITELVGLDLKRAILEELLPSLASSTEIPPILNEKVERGELGVKTGKGFYEWTPESAEALRARIAHALVEIDRWSQES